MLTYTNKSLDALRDVAARVPLDRILVETDSPYLSPHPFRGKTNEPARVAVTALRLAEIRRLDPRGARPDHHGERPRALPPARRFDRLIAAIIAFLTGRFDSPAARATRPTGGPRTTIADGVDDKVCPIFGFSQIHA